MQKLEKPVPRCVQYPCLRAMSPGPGQYDYRWIYVTSFGESVTHCTISDALVLDSALEPSPGCLAWAELGWIRALSHSVGDDRAFIRQRTQICVVLRTAEKHEGPSFVVGLLSGWGTR